VSPHLVYTDDAVSNEVSKNADDYKRSRVDGRLVAFLEQEQRNDANNSAETSTLAKNSVDPLKILRAATRSRLVFVVMSNAWKKFITTAI
jgi:hypothetical protein